MLPLTSLDDKNCRRLNRMLPSTVEYDSNMFREVRLSLEGGDEWWRRSWYREAGGTGVE